METMLVCEKLAIPVALDKQEGPATTITFLGITIDTTLQQLRLPPDKLQEMTLLIISWRKSTRPYESPCTVTTWQYLVQSVGQAPVSNPQRHSVLRILMDGLAGYDASNSFA
eukprot:Em0007g1557a